MARNPGGAYPAHRRAAAGLAGGVVHSGHHGIGFHQPAGDCRAGAVERSAAAWAVRPSTLAITPDGVPLGVLDTGFWTCDRATFGDDQRHWLIEAKESMRWLEGFERRAEWAATLSDTRLVYVADRECNIHECMIRARRWPGPPPVIPPPLPIMLGWIARLGGPSGRQCDGPPGP